MFLYGRIWRRHDFPNLMRNERSVPESKVGQQIILAAKLKA